MLVRIPAPGWVKLVRIPARRWVILARISPPQVGHPGENTWVMLVGNDSQIARAESRMETGGRTSPTVVEVLANIGATLSR